MLEDILKIIIIIIFITILVNFILILFYLVKLINLSPTLKAEQYSHYNKYCEKGKIVFLGDSLTEFYHTQEFLFGNQIYNRGIASDTTDGVLNRLENNILVMEPSKVFIQIGINDFSKRKSRSITYITNNIKKIILKINTSSPTTEIYFISLYPINSKAKIISKLFTRYRKNSNIIKVNEIMRNFCYENNYTFIDIFKSLIDDKGNLRKEYTIEGLHININGYEIITNILKPYLNNK